MKKKNGRFQYAVCVKNNPYPESLDLFKIYRVMPDEKAAKHGFVRIIDETGEDYLYSAKMFVEIELPLALKKALKGAA